MRFNQAEYAEYYHRQMIESGYPGKLLPFILEKMENFYTVIDIGSGTGFFSVPLALSGHKVTAVEPSAEMIKVMIKNTSSEILSRINICNTPWGQWSGDLHDAAVCIHSLYPMPDIKAALTMMKNSAARSYLIVRNTGGMRTLSGIIRTELGLASNRDLNDDIAGILEDLSVEWKTENIHEERIHPVKGIQHEADSLIYQLKIDQNMRKPVLDIIERETENVPEGKIFRAVYSDNVYIF